MAHPKNKNINRMSKLFMIIFLLFFFVIMVRFAFIGITKNVHGHDLMAMAHNRWTTTHHLQSQRGKILDTHGNVLAKDVPSYTLIAVVSEEAKYHVKNKRLTARKLSPILHMKKQKIIHILSKDAYQVEFGLKGHRLSYAKKQKIAQLDLPGIRFLPAKHQRYYPNQAFASYVLGYTKRIEKIGQRRGMMGVEASMNEYLVSKDGQSQYTVGQEGVKLPGTESQKSAAKNGSSVYLTINSQIQTFLEHAMDKAQKAYDPKGMMAVVMDPETGEILAMSSRPSFNPNTLNDIESYLNPIISEPFEPGSTMKIFTLSAAVDLGVYHGDATFMSGEYELPYGNSIHDWNNSGWGIITFDQAVRRSSNVGFAHLASDYIGFDRLMNYFERFDLKQKTGIKLPDEANSDFQYNRIAGKVTTAYGQGTAITAIQLIKGATAIANNGKMMKPRIIDKIVNPKTGEVIKDFKPKVAGQPISAESAKKVRSLLRTVVTAEDGTGQEFAIKGYKVAGKTGTAMIPAKNGSGYMNDKYIHSFIGMAPKKDPELLMYVAVDRPDVKISYYGSRPVANIFTSVMKNSLQYLNIAPKNNEVNIDKTKINDYSGKTVQQVRKQADQHDLKVSAFGSGDTVISQWPSPGTVVLPHTTIFLNTGGPYKMPDMTGWSAQDVMTYARLLQLEPVIKGSGYVTKQSIQPGETIDEKTKIIVHLSEDMMTKRDKKHDTNQK